MVFLGGETLDQRVGLRTAPNAKAGQLFHWPRIAFGVKAKALIQNTGFRIHSDKPDMPRNTDEHPITKLRRLDLARLDNGLAHQTPWRAEQL
jgi:hypothetical protein